MNIYVSHSSNFDYQTELYLPLKTILKDHTLILPHEKDAKPFPVRELFSDKKCDLVIAEVSFPSTGQGIELGWADSLKIPVLYLLRKDIKASESIFTISSKMIIYDQLIYTKDTILSEVTSFLS
ncbi:MAG: hypothetical protein ACEQSA_00250 [Weeksellaceae bacterium]